MPLLKSAHKKMQQDQKRTTRNKNQKTKLHQAILKLKKAAQKKETAKLPQLFQLAQKKLDKAVKKNLLPAKTSARQKSQLAKLLKKKAAPTKDKTANPARLSEN